MISFHEIFIYLSIVAAIADGFSTTCWTSAGSFYASAPQILLRERQPSPSYTTLTSYLRLVTEQEVIEAVEQAEKLWAKALEARKNANALSDRAEEEAEAAADLSESVAAEFQSMQAISAEKIAQADAATKSNIDANSMVSKAMRAADEADELEAQAEKALQLSEEKLDQHLKDFPESPLAD
jgi:uncharacterized coiled-coil DUF342 family protein